MVVCVRCNNGTSYRHQLNDVAKDMANTESARMCRLMADKCHKKNSMCYFFHTKKLHMSHRLWHMYSNTQLLFLRDNFF